MKRPDGQTGDAETKNPAGQAASERCGEYRNWIRALRPSATPYENDVSTIRLHDLYRKDGHVVLWPVRTAPMFDLRQQLIDHVIERVRPIAVDGVE